MNKIFYRTVGELQDDSVGIKIVGRAREGIRNPASFMETHRDTEKGKEEEEEKTDMKYLIEGENSEEEQEEEGRRRNGGEGKR